MSPPVSEAHPAEIVFAVEALHVIAPTVLFNTDIAFGTVLNKNKRLTVNIVTQQGEQNNRFKCVAVEDRDRIEDTR